MTEAQVAADEINARTARWEKALDDMFREALRSTVKHGDQHHLPNGTGPHTNPLEFHEARVFHNDFASLLAEIAKASTDARSHSLGDGTVSWRDILLEEVMEAFAEDDPAKLREELVQSGSVILKWIEALDRPLGRPEQ